MLPALLRTGTLCHDLRALAHACSLLGPSLQGTTALAASISAISHTPDRLLLPRSSTAGHGDDGARCSTASASAGFNSFTHEVCSTSTRGFFAAASSVPTAKKFNQRKLVGWSPEQMYAVVSQVEHYHKFVPWCQKSRVMLRRDAQYMEAELEVGFQLLVERYTSQVYLSPPHQVRSTVKDSCLFDHLDSTWTMQPGPTARTCWLSFDVDFAFQSQLHGYLADLFFSEVVKQMTAAFEGRCAKVYGPSALLSMHHAGNKPAHAK